jgi:hypothetical protein
LRLGNRDIAEFRGDFLGYSPAERASAAHERLSHIIRSHHRGDRQAKVDVNRSDIGWIYLVDRRMVFTLTAADADTLGDETVAGVMERTRTNLVDAVTASLEQRSPARLLRSILFAVLATLALWFLLRGLSRAGKWVHARLSGAMQRRTESMHLPSSVHAGQLNHGLRTVIRAVTVVLGLALVDVWLTFVLKQFPYTYPWGDQIDDYLFAALSSIGLGILHSIPDLLMLALIFVIAAFRHALARDVVRCCARGAVYHPRCRRGDRDSGQAPDDAFSVGADVCVRVPVHSRKPGRRIQGRERASRRDALAGFLQRPEPGRQRVHADVLESAPGERLHPHW